MLLNDYLACDILMLFLLCFMLRVLQNYEALRKTGLFFLLSLSSQGKFKTLFYGTFYQYALLVLLLARSFAAYPLFSAVASTVLHS